MTCDYAKKVGVEICKIPPEVRKAPTPVVQEQVEDDIETEEMLKGTVIVLQEVQRIKPEAGKSYTMDCPFCNSVSAMNFALSTLNSHLHASCNVCSTAIMQ